MSFAFRTGRSQHLFPLAFRARGFSTPATDKVVKIVEVGPRDGLQNERGHIPVELKVALIDRLSEAGMNVIEAGSFVSPKWVPQMAGTADVLKGIKRYPGVHYPVLIPNSKGLHDLFGLLDTNLTADPPLTDEISVFTAATEAFTRANLNATIAESLEKFSGVIREALDKRLRVRGYVSVVVACPFSGKTDVQRVKEITKELIEMGCYEVSLGDTIGKGRPHEIKELLYEVTKAVPVEKLAGHFHDTYGTGVANVLAALEQGIRTIDSSVGGLGGCPFAPGATGNVATEDVLFALQGSGYQVSGSLANNNTIDIQKIVDIAWWISEKLGRGPVSRVGRAIKPCKANP